MRAAVLCALVAACVALTLPLSSDIRSLEAFTENSASSIDSAKNYALFIYDGSCESKGSKCMDLESSLLGAMSITDQNESFNKYKSSLVFAKVNKDDFPKYNKEFEKAKLSLPVVIFWPAGQFRPSCKFDSTHPTPSSIADWLSAKLSDEDSGASTFIQKDAASFVCQADKPAARKEEAECVDHIFQDLMQVEKTQKIWDFKTAETKFIGPADNSLSHDLTDAVNAPAKSLDLQHYQALNQEGKYVAMYFSAPWCQYCDCLEPVWQSVSNNLVGSQRQPDLVVAKVDGDANPQLRTLFDVTVYPTFLLINKDGTKVLGRYLGPRKTFELSTWIEDLIVADANPIVKHQFAMTEQGEHPDLHPVFPYTGPSAFGEQTLASLSVATTGNDFDECVDSDENKFTAPGAALLVHYSSDPSTIRALEMDSSVVSTKTVPNKLTVIDFFAPWCPHCQKLNPVWDTVNSHFANDNVVIGKVDVEAHADVKRDFGIHRFPTIMYFEAGKPMKFDEAHRYTGQRDAEHLEQWVNQLKASQPAPQVALQAALPVVQAPVPAPVQPVIGQHVQ